MRPLVGITMPMAYGGSDGGAARFLEVAEEMASAGAPYGALFAETAQLWSVQHPILRFGTDAQRAAWLPALISGSWRGAHAVSEANGASDAFVLQTTAVRDGDGFRINGSKSYVTSAPGARIAIVLAATAPERGSWGLTAFVVDLEQRGIRRGSPFKPKGLEGAEVGSLHFEDCFVPATALLGREGGGAAIFHYAMEHERAFILAPVLGRLRRQLEGVVELANTTRRSGHTLGRFQSVTNRIADMATRLHVARLLLKDAAEAWDQGRSLRGISAIVKLALSELVLASTLDEVRTSGAEVVLSGRSLHLEVWDALAALNYSGTSDVLRNQIARLAGVRNVVQS